MNFSLVTLLAKFAIDNRYRNACLYHKMRGGNPHIFIVLGKRNRNKARFFVQ
jgi:hypothetical protein